MKKIVITLFLCTIFIVTTFLDSPTNILTVNAEKTVPSHARWGRIAMQKTKEKYPNAKIYDYLHVKREQKEQYSIEIFKLWLNEDNEKFEIMVNVKFDTQTEKVLNVSITRAPSSKKQHVCYIKS
ncbi:DUF3889 domain-containing protein [Priestia aryabhattai]|uniref:DUF3889 domain-containing protein n=1 Tax=Priestia aryabhattai TaxID=412384 RepID=UPI003CE87E0F